MLKSGQFSFWLGDAIDCLPPPPDNGYSVYGWTLREPCTNIANWQPVRRAGFVGIWAGARGNSVNARQDRKHVTVCVSS